MMSSKRQSAFFTSDWFLAACLTALFMLANRYILGWDDQHLEIPLLKKLIDPSLYPGDYYVDSLKENFTSYLYPLLSRIITVAQIPFVYLTLYVISRYFMFFWMLKLWSHLAEGNKKTAGFMAVAMFFLIGRTEEFLYRTFSHQEFAFAFIFAAIYLFFKDRHILAALVLGVAANFHALYALFPMFYFTVYHVFFKKEGKVKYTIACGITFLTGALPFLFWAIPRAIEKRLQVDPDVFTGWIDMFVIACPYNFFLHTYPLEAAWPTLAEGLANSGTYIFLLVVYIFNLIVNEQFRTNRKAQGFCAGCWLLLLASVYVSYINPSRFGLDLNLIRSAQYLQFLLMGFTTLYIFRAFATQKSLIRNSLAAVILVVLGLRSIQGAAILLIAWGVWTALSHTKTRRVCGVIGCVAGGILAWIVFPEIGTGLEGKLMRYLPAVLLAVIMAAAVRFWPAASKQTNLRPALMALPLLWLFGYFCYIHVIFVHNQQKGGGFWELQRNWENMQHHVRDNTPKDAVFLVPYDMEMGGFRIFSERTIVASYRDCGIVGFDYPAVTEWKRRIDDIKTFKIIAQKSIQPAVMNAIGKYNVDYIVFMRYYAPKADTNLLSKEYENDVFVLYRINRTS